VNGVSHVLVDLDMALETLFGACRLGPGTGGRDPDLVNEMTGHEDLRADKGFRHDFQRLEVGHLLAAAGSQNKDRKDVIKITRLSKAAI
jgi:hypothetical protein